MNSVTSKPDSTELAVDRTWLARAHFDGVGPDRDIND
jgi:hypothetical protein